ncbi:SagB/ThcOx family dehydrogenase [Candidatus Hydrogenedentota bacterium]
MENIGEFFQEETKYVRGRLPRGGSGAQQAPEHKKTYPGTRKISLSTPKTDGGKEIWSVVSRRRSVRKYINKPIPEPALSQLLWISQGISSKGKHIEFRTAPSAGALYPVETYLFVHSVQGIEPGLYHYSVGEHELEQLKTGNFRGKAAHVALDQMVAYDAGVVFAWTAVFERAKWKYCQRAYRYVYLDVGHIAQNLALAAAAMKLGSCQIAALYDDEVNALLGVDGKEESVLYMTAVGMPA